MVTLLKPVMERRAFLGGALAAAVLPGCCHSAVNSAGWTTQGGTEYVLPRWQWAPKSARELVETVKRAKAEGRRVRMTGSKHSYSDVAIVDDWLLEPHGLARPLELDVETLRSNVDRSTLVRIASGLRIRELNCWLRNQRLALQNMGGWDAQTYVGAAMTGTHGSGLAFGPLASQIESIQVVAKGGEIIQVEPSNGISDKTRFPAPLREDPSLKVILQQDDALFDSLAVSMGSLGVVYAVTLRAVPIFWLTESRTTGTWEDLVAPTGPLTRFLRGEQLLPRYRDPDHIEVYLCPYPRPDGKHATLFTQRWRHETKPPLAGKMTRKGSALEALGVLADEAGLLEPFLNAHDTDGVRKLQEDGLSSQATPYYADISYRVFSTGQLNRLGVYGIEPAFAIHQTVDAVQTFLRIASYLADEGIRHSSPVSVRFGAASRANLSMAQGRQTMTIEMANLKNAPHSEEMFRTYEDVFVHGQLQARPHWGLDRNVLRGWASVEALYPDTAWTWRKAYDELNPDGTFDARFTDRLGISRRPRTT
jgi:uncharacterized protein with GYD domain